MTIGGPSRMLKSAGTECHPVFLPPACIAYWGCLGHLDRILALRLFVANQTMAIVESTISAKGTA